MKNKSGRRTAFAFKEKANFNQLKFNHRVIVFRKNASVEGSIWIQEFSSSYKAFDAEIVDKTECIDRKHVAKLVKRDKDLSGFESFYEWIEAIKDRNNGKMPREGYMLEITTTQQY